MGTSRALKANQFPVDRVQRQAKQEGVTLSEPEISMLGFAEEGASSRELDIARQFESEIDDRQYESKIADLLKHAYREAKFTTKPHPLMMPFPPSPRRTPTY